MKSDRHLTLVMVEILGAARNIGRITASCASGPSCEKADGQNGLGPVRMPAPAGTADRSSSSSSIAAVNCEL